MTWKLVDCNYRECTYDGSGYYTIINRVEQKGYHKEYSGVWIKTRLDVMTDKDEPVISFIGTAENVYKAFAEWVGGKLSPEHLLYIGYELHRAETTADYKQR